MSPFCTTPYIYTLEIVSACNARCPGCGNVFEHTPRPEGLTPQQMAQILERIGPYAEMLRVTGGEPTLSPFFAELLRQMDALGKPLVVFSNGCWPAPEPVIEALAACRHLDGVLISLHGPTPESHQAFTGVDTWARVVANVRRAHAAGLVVNTNTILTRHNLDRLEQVAETATQAGAHVVAFSRYYGQPLSGLTDLTPAEMQHAVQQIAHLRAQGYKIKFNNNLPFCLAETPTQICPAGDTHCTISPTAQVRLCNHSPLVAGDILTTPVAQIWQSPVVQAWRAGGSPTCQRCAAYAVCRGGCRAHAQANHADTDPLAGQGFTQPPAQPRPQHRLLASAIPKAAFAVRAESFGYVLICRSQIVKIGAEAKPLVETLVRGETPLRDIGQTFGPAALNFVGGLYDRRMIELTLPPEAPR